MNENIIRTISSEMNIYLNNYQMSKLQEVLYRKVEIEKKEISNDEYVNKFINSKRLEGCSELTIKNYKIHIYKMLTYLDRDIRTIETDDIRDFLSYYQLNNNCNNKPHERVQSRGIELMLQKLGKELGEEKVYPHKFRKTLATKIKECLLSKFNIYSGILR